MFPVVWVGRALGTPRNEQQPWGLKEESHPPHLPRGQLRWSVSAGTHGRAARGRLARHDISVASFR